MAAIRVNLYTRYAKNINHINKDSKDLLSVIVILGTNANSGETVFYDEYNMNDIGKRAQVLKHSHRRCVIGSFAKNLHEGSIWTDNRAVLSFILHKTNISSPCA